MVGRTPAAWGNRPVCNTAADLLDWFDRQANRHLSVLRRDRCKVLASGANMGESEETYFVSPELIIGSQRTFASDILYAHDWLDVNPIPNIPQRPVGLESEADGSEALTERIVSEYSKLRRALASVAVSDSLEADDQYGPVNAGVSMLDAALILCEDDRPLAREKRAAWQKLRDPIPPASVGRCPNHKQVKLFAPSALCDFIEKIEDPKDCREHKLRQRLVKKTRRPRQV